MRLLRAFALGCLAGGIVSYAAAATIGLAVGAAGSELRAAIGPAMLLAVETGSDGTAATFGPGLLLLALATGLVNVAVAAVLARLR